MYVTYIFLEEMTRVYYFVARVKLKLRFRILCLYIVYIYLLYCILFHSEYMCWPGHSYNILGVNCHK